MILAEVMLLMMLLNNSNWKKKQFTFILKFLYQLNYRFYVFVVESFFINTCYYNNDKQTCVYWYS